MSTDTAGRDAAWLAFNPKGVATNLERIAWHAGYAAALRARSESTEDHLEQARKIVGQYAKTFGDAEWTPYLTQDIADALAVLAPAPPASPLPEDQQFAASEIIEEMLDAFMEWQDGQRPSQATVHAYLDGWRQRMRAAYRVARMHALAPPPVVPDEVRQAFADYERNTISVGSLGRTAAHWLRSLLAAPAQPEPEIDEARMREAVDLGLGFGFGLAAPAQPAGDARGGDMMATVRALEAQSELLTRRIRGLEEALKFYADEWLSEVETGLHYEPTDALWNDKGQRARAILRGDGK